MEVSEGDFILLSYTGDFDSQVFDTTDEQEAQQAEIHNPSALYGPVTIRVGSRHVIVGLDEDLPGKEVDFGGEIDVPPEKAFGDRDPKKVESFPKSRFSEKPVKGTRVKVEELGEGVVIDSIGGRVIVDFNHPLAGKTLHYRFRIEGKVKPVEEKVRGLIRLYSGRDMEMNWDGERVTIDLPPGINYDRRWVLWRSRVIHEAFEYIPSIREITLVETFKRPKKGEAVEGMGTG
jgi:FKBP-type peptidyl-prolyl cis-trans isomerase SlyD